MILKIDSSRLQHLRSVCDREARALDHAFQVQEEAAGRARRIRSEILALQRRSAKGDKLELTLARKRAELGIINERIETTEQTIDVARQQCAAARKLYTSCDAFAANQVKGRT